MMRKFIVNAITLILIGNFAALAHSEMAYSIETDENGRTWIVDPAGERFLSIGINNIQPAAWNPRAGSDYYNAIEDVFGGDSGAWLDSVGVILERAGMNTVGCWSSPLLNAVALHQTPIVYIAGHAQERCLDGLRANFEEQVRANFEEVLAEWPDQSRVAGYFIDNEAAWYGTTPWTDLKNDTLLEAAFRLPEGDEAREAAIDFLRGRYSGSIDEFNAAWRLKVADWDALDYETLRRGMTDAAMADRSDFVALCADRFFAIGSKVLNELAPGKLNLGVRFAGHAPEEVVRACGQYCDVISFNDYRFGDSADPDPERIAKMYLWGGKKPLMVTEYSWRAAENQSGNPNTGGAGTVVATQQERADRNTRYLEQLFEYPMVVGAHWFEWADQSPQGRFDGENSNYGVVDISHGTYETLIDSMGAINGRVHEIHANSTMAAPTELPKPPAVIFEPGQYPDRPPTLELLKIESTQPPAVWGASDATLTLNDGPGRSMRISLDAGRDWGAGLSLFGPAERALEGSEEASDLDGYSRIVVEVEASEETQFRVLLDEAAVGPPGNSTDGTLGDDGESYASEFFFGTGATRAYTIEIASMEHRGDWGNQTGARRIDLQAAKGIGLYFPGLQGQQEIRLSSVRLER